MSGLGRFRPLPSIGLPFLIGTMSMLVLSSPAAAANFERLSWGQSRAEVAQIYLGEVVEAPVTRSRPRGTDGGQILLPRGHRLFGVSVDAQLHFKGDSLEVIRLISEEKSHTAIERIITVYSSSEGKPLKAIGSAAGEKTTTWSWPWSGIELRSVEQDGDILYLRLDISRTLQLLWLSADAAVCSLLPGTSSCNLEHRFCASSSQARRKQEERALGLDVGGRMGEVTCAYKDGELRQIGLAIPSATDTTADWLTLIFQQRLGEGQTSREERGSANIQLRTRWPEHGVDLLIVRAALVERAQGWTGPVEFVRIRRTVRSDSATPGDPLSDPPPLPTTKPGSDVAPATEPST